MECHLYQSLSLASFTHMGHVGIEHQSIQMEHQQPHSLPTEPVSMIDLQAKDSNSEHRHPPFAKALEGLHPVCDSRGGRRPLPCRGSH